MLDVRSADGLRRAPRVRAVMQAATFTPRQKLLLLALNVWPLAHLATAVALALLSPWSVGGRVAVALAWLLILPALLQRAIVGQRLPVGQIAVPSPAFFHWWTTWQLQMIFNRLPWIEELLRLVPGLYSIWLRMWGAQIGRLTLWSPGTRVFDRSLLRLGNDVVIGIDVRLLGHFGDLDSTGRAVMVLGPVTVGDRTTIGGGALLGPGVMLHSDQVTETLFLGAPFTHWQAGHRVRSTPGLSPHSPKEP